MLMARVVPGPTVCAPDGETVPFVPAEDVMVYPAKQVPPGRQ